MADSKGRGGFDRERMRSQLGDFWRTARGGLDDLKDVMVRASHTAKVKLDAAFLRRERDRLFQQLGEETYRLIESGELNVPELRDTVSRIDALIEQIAQEESAHGGAWSQDVGFDEDFEEGYEEEGYEEAAEEEVEAAPEPEPTPAKKRSTSRKKTSRKTAKKPEEED